jgi:SAM-dependent methyltransferase
MTITNFEIAYLCLEPFLLPLYRQMRRRVRKVTQEFRERPALLDVGGRKSPYTIAVPADVTIIDLPRASEVQHALNLGLLPEHLEKLRARRSNVRQILLQDMTQNTLPDSSYDVVVAVEVLEHVEADRLFVQQVARVLKPGGYFLLSTPNGDYVPNHNPDHKRHYTRAQLHALLAAELSAVSVDYAVRDGRFYTWGLGSWSLRKPVHTAQAMLGNFINFIESSTSAIKEQAHGTQHLVACARKRT